MANTQEEIEPKSTRLIRVAMIDDNLSCLDLVHSILDFTPDLQLIIKEQSECDFQLKVQELRPQAIVVDMNISEPGSGLKLLDWAHVEFPEMSRIALSVDEKWILRVYESGAHGFLLKSQIGEIARIIRRTLFGEIIIPNGIHKILLSQSLERKRLLQSKVGWEILSARENDILRSLAEGHPRDRIAEKLCISAFTVRRHIENILEKTNLNSILDVLDSYRKAISEL